MADEMYNGWTNRETWAAALMIDNHAGTYNERCRIVADNYPDVWDTQRAIESWLVSWFENVEGAELAWLREVGSQWRIDWHEIVTAWIAEHAENNPPEEAICQHCSRRITRIGDGPWIDPNATGDDEVWAESCDARDTFTAEHEPEEEADV